MRKPSDTDLMIKVLEEAALRSDKDPSVEFDKPRTNRELSIIYDLIDDQYIRGSIVTEQDGVTPRGAAMGGINLSGRNYLEQLTQERRAKSTWRRLVNLIWLGTGWLLGHISDLWPTIKSWFAH